MEELRQRLVKNLHRDIEKDVRESHPFPYGSQNVASNYITKLSVVLASS